VSGGSIKGYSSDAAIGISTDPVDGRWSVSALPVSSPIDSISCPTASFCAATTNAGTVLVSYNPAGGASSWSIAPLDLSQSLTGTFTAVNGVTCPTQALCLAVDGKYGNIAYGEVAEK